MYSRRLRMRREGGGDRTQEERDVSELAERIRERIAEIPASGGGYMSLYPETLRQKLSDELLDRIASVAADEAQVVLRRQGSGA